MRPIRVPSREHYRKDGARGWLPKAALTEERARDLAARDKDRTAKAYRCKSCNQWHVGHGRTS